MTGRILTSWLGLLLSLGLAACAQPQLASRGKLPLRAVNEAPHANLVQQSVENFNPGFDAGWRIGRTRPDLHESNHTASRRIRLPFAPTSNLSQTPSHCLFSTTN